jgi:hypothetical protein
MDPEQNPIPADPNQITIGNAKLSRSFIVGWSFFLAILFGFIAYLFASNAITLMLYGKEVEGTITSTTAVHSVGTNGGGFSWNVDMSYTGQDGNQYNGEISNSPTSLGTVGNTVSILYNPNSPSDIAVANYFFLIAQIALFSLLPLVALIVGIVVLVKKPKQSQ